MKHKAAEQGGEGRNKGFHVDRSRVLDLKEAEQAKPGGHRRTSQVFRGEAEKDIMIIWGRNVAGDLNGSECKCSEGCIFSGKRLTYNGNLQELMIPAY